MKDLNPPILSDWLQGKLSPEEESSLNNVYDMDQLKTILTNQKLYSTEQVESQVLWEAIKSNTFDTKKQQRSFKYWWLVTIGLIGLISIISIYYFSSNLRIHSPSNKTTEHFLADNSKIILSPESSIEYNPRSFTEARDIHLQGQAFFEVNKGTPFTVFTSNAQIQVLGTAFEVWSLYGGLEVKCHHGKVAVKVGDQEKVLTAGQYVRLNNGLLSNVSQVDKLEIDFLSNKMKYQQIALKYLFDELERFYDIKVSSNEIDLQKTYSGVLILNDLPKAISYISETMSLKYDMQDQNLVFTN